MKKYVISGIEIKISDEVQEYIEACNIWFDKADKMVDNFILKVRGVNCGLARAVDKMKFEANNSIETAIDIVVQNLMEKGIYVVTRERVYSDFSSELNMSFAFSKAYSYLNQLDDAHREMENIKEDIANNRSTWSGGGFGVRGAIKGAAMASVANAFSDAYASSKVKSFSKEMGDELRKMDRECWIEERGDILEEAAEGLRNVLYYVPNIYFAYMAKVGLYQLPHFDYNRLKNIITNINRSNKSFENLPQMIFPFLGEAPYNSDIYYLLVPFYLEKKDYGNLNELCRFADGVNRKWIIAEILEEHYSEKYEEKLPWEEDEDEKQADDFDFDALMKLSKTNEIRCEMLKEFTELSKNVGEELKECFKGIIEAQKNLENSVLGEYLNIFFSDYAIEKSTLEQIEALLALGNIVYSCEKINYILPENCQYQDQYKAHQIYTRISNQFNNIDKTIFESIGMPVEGFLDINNGKEMKRRSEINYKIVSLIKERILNYYSISRHFGDMEFDSFDELNSYVEDCQIIKRYYDDAVKYEQRYLKESEIPIVKHLIEEIGKCSVQSAYWNEKKDSILKQISDSVERTETVEYPLDLKVIDIADCIFNEKEARAYVCLATDETYSKEYDKDAGTGCFDTFKHTPIILVKVVSGRLWFSRGELVYVDSKGCSSTVIEYAKIKKIVQNNNTFDIKFESSFLKFESRSIIKSQLQALCDGLFGKFIVENKRRHEEEKAKIKQERQKELNEKRNLFLGKIYKSEAYNKPELACEYRKRFKALMGEKYQPVGYDFYDDNYKKIPEKLKDLYDVCGDYILLAAEVAEVPIVITDRVLWIKEFCFKVSSIQEVVCYSEIPNSVSGSEKVYGLVFFERESVKLIIVPYDEQFKMLAYKLTVALKPYRNPSYHAISESAGFEGICPKCNGRYISEGVFGSKCKSCGNTIHLFRNRTRHDEVIKEEKLLETNFNLRQNEGWFNDEKEWIDWVKQTPQEIERMEVDSTGLLSGEIRCKCCGEIILKTSKFCNFCGEKNECDEQQNGEGIQYCSKCGEMIEHNAKFCAFCGTKVEG